MDFLGVDAVVSGFRSYIAVLHRLFATLSAAV